MTVTVTVQGIGTTQTEMVADGSTVTIAFSTSGGPPPPPPPGTPSNLTFGHAGTAATNFTTTSIAPTANALVLCSVVTYNNTVAPTLTGGGMPGWAMHTSTIVGTWHLYVFRAMSATPGSGPVVISFGSQSEPDCEWSVDQFPGATQGGTNGSAAIVQAANATHPSPGGQTSVGVTLAAFASASNYGFGFAINATAVAAMSVGFNFTSLSSQYFTDPTYSFHTASGTEFNLNAPAIGYNFATNTDSSAIIGLEISMV